MQKIGSILTKHFQNPTLQRVYWEHRCQNAVQEVCGEMRLQEVFTQIEWQYRQEGRAITVYAATSNTALISHLKIYSEQFQDALKTKLTTPKTTCERVTLITRRA